MEKFNESEVLKDLITILNKLLESKPELQGWAEKNFGKYMEKK
jgi:hypothetical protein